MSATQEALTDKSCPCGNAIVRDGVVVKSHWTGSICEDCGGRNLREAQSGARGRQR